MHFLSLVISNLNLLFIFFIVLCGLYKSYRPYNYFYVLYLNCFKYKFSLALLLIITQIVHINTHATICIFVYLYYIKNAVADIYKIYIPHKYAFFIKILLSTELIHFFFIETLFAFKLISTTLCKTIVIQCTTLCFQLVFFFCSSQWICFGNLLEFLFPYT